MSKAKDLLEELGRVLPELFKEPIQEFEEEEEEVDNDAMDLKPGDTAVIDLEVKVTMNKESDMGDDDEEDTDELDDLLGGAGEMAPPMPGEGEGPGPAFNM